MNFLLFINKYFTYILLLFSLVSLAYSFKSCQSYKLQLEISTHNVNALNDTVKVILTKLGEQVYTRLSLQGELESIKQYNEELYNNINNLKKQLRIKDNIISGLEFSASISNLKHDTVWEVSSKDTSFIKSFDFSNKYRKLTGNLEYNYPNLEMSIDSDYIYIDYTIAMDESNRIYIKSDNPYCTINSISSFSIPKHKEKRFSIGPCIGIGYDLQHCTLSPTIGLSLQYSIYKF